MDVSVIIPTFNKKAELRRCLNAVLGQQFGGEFEVLVCDDGSSDGTADMLEQWSRCEPRLRALRQQSRGPAAARNLGIRHARGPLVAMTDDDTIPDPVWLARLCEAASRPGVVGVEGRVTPGRPLGALEAAPVNEGGGVCLTCNALYRRDELARAGGFDERFPYAAYEDCDLAAKLRERGEIAWAPEAVVLHPPRRLTFRSTLQRLRHWPWIMVVAQRYGYLGWPRFPTRRPRARVIWNCLVQLPAGRLLSALKALPRPAAFRAAIWALAEPFAALFYALPRLARFDLASAALVMDHLDLNSPKARVGVVIVHYRRPEQLLRCLESLARLEYPDLCLIVVESAAGGIEANQVRRRLPEVQWLASPENLGYTGGNNLGIERALELGCEYVLLINDDTECIEPGFVRRLVSFLDLNPRVALAGPRVFLYRRGQVQNTILRYPSPFRNLVDWFGFRLFPKLYDRSGNSPRTAEMLNGVCVMLRAAAIRQVGAFDSRFFMYVEDADLGLRLRNAGWQLAYVPIDSIVHLQKTTGYDLFSRPSLLLRRNSVYFLQKHGRPVQAWALAAANLSLGLLRTCAATSTDELRRRASFLRALWSELRDVLWSVPTPSPDAAGGMSGPRK